MKRFLQLFLFGIFWLLIFSQTAMGQESGWAGDGLIKFQKFPTDTIVKYGLSADGDTLKTFHKDFKLYYWDIISGKLLKEKQLPEGVKVAEDMLTYFNYRDSSKAGSGLYIANIHIKDIYSDLVILSIDSIDLPREDFLTYYKSHINYSSYLQKIILILSCRYDSGGTASSYFETCLVSLINDSLIIDKTKKINLGGVIHYNSNYNKVLYTRETSYRTKPSISSSSVSFGQWEMNKTQEFVIFSSTESISNYRYPRFLNDDNKVSAFNSRTLHIWKLNPVVLIEEHNPIKGYDSYSDYLYMRDDNFLAYSNDKIFIYDMKSKRIIDSSEAVSTNKSTLLLYSNSNDKLCFLNNDKFGIYESSKLNDIGKISISVDSTHAYTGKPFNIYIYGISDSAKVKWETSDGQTSNLRNSSFIFGTPGYISFTATVNDDGIEYVKTYDSVVKVIPMLIADFESDVNEGPAPLKVKFTNKSKGDIKSFKWVFVNGNEKHESTEENPKITFFSTGYVSVELIIKDSLFTIKRIKDFFVAVNNISVKSLDVLNIYNLTSSKFMYDDGSGQNKEAFTWSKHLGTFILHDTIFNLKVDKKFGWSNEYLLLSNIDKNDIYSYKSGINNQALLHTNPSDLLYFYDDRVGVFGNNTLFVVRTPFEQITPYENYKWVGTNDEWFGNTPKNYLAFSTDSSAMVGVNYIEGGCSIVTYGKDYKITYSNDLNGTICGITYNPKRKNFYYMIKDSNYIVSRYKIYKLDINRNLISNVIVDVNQNININTINFSNDNEIIFCGFDKKNNNGIVGIINESGNIKWMKNFELWDVFTKIVTKEKSFFVTGKSKLTAGFIEISNDGKKFNEYAFKCYNDLKNTVDLDILNDTILVLTNFIENKEMDNYCFLYLSKVKYSPLFKEDTPADTTKPQDSIKMAVRVSVHPNPAKGEVKFSFKEEVTAREIQLFNTDGIMVERKLISSAKISEYSINIDKLVIGIYFVKIYTDSGIIETKFIKG